MSNPACLALNPHYPKSAGHNLDELFSSLLHLSQSCESACILPNVSTCFCVMSNLLSASPPSNVLPGRSCFQTAKLVPNVTTPHNRCHFVCGKEQKLKTYLPQRNRKGKCFCNYES
ncbi:hypothetical protein PoB_000195300 [Plakobranchus ocellatus]|uniref:Uncharacterized protein n=1 Tax=Plakobranchus ocellatus TaxID=259542 RepID=A0AAV3XZ19_9GAST|nr:hypothetical protein PoB_000195300 [Plakobranchus ocellatus]